MDKDQISIQNEYEKKINIDVDWNTLTGKISQGDTFNFNVLFWKLVDAKMSNSGS